MPYADSAREIIASQYPESRIADGLDDAIIGMAYRIGDTPVVAYDHEKCVEILMEQGMEEDEAAITVSQMHTDAEPCENAPVFIRSVPYIC